MTNETNFIQKAKAALDQQADSLDSQTLQRLRDARETALSQQSFTKMTWLRKIISTKSLSMKWLTGAGAGLAVASILTFMLAPQLTANKLSPLDDLEILTAEADMDLVTQLDFYQWLDESLDES